MACETINPKWCESGIASGVGYEQSDGTIIFRNQDDQREFLTEVLESGRDARVIERLYKETARCILLVRDRLEREKPIEIKLEQSIGGEDE